MKPLTEKEEAIMTLFWAHGPMQIRELQALYDEPQPHVNTLSTLVRILEDKGFLTHRAVRTRCFEYLPSLSREEYKGGTLVSLVDKLFNRSCLSAVSALVKSEKISVDELRELIKEVEGE